MSAKNYRNNKIIIFIHSNTQNNIFLQESLKHMCTKCIAVNSFESIKTEFHLYCPNKLSNRQIKEKEIIFYGFRENCSVNDNMGYP